MNGAPFALELERPRPVVAPPAPPDQSRQKTAGIAAMRAFYENRTLATKGRTSGLRVRRLLEEKRMGRLKIPELHPAVLAECLPDLMAELATARPHVRASVLAFLGLVTLAQRRRQYLVGARRYIAEVVGWAPRTGDRWLATLERLGALQVQPYFVTHAAGGTYKHSQGPNIFMADLWLWGAIKADAAPNWRAGVERRAEKKKWRAIRSGSFPASEKERLAKPAEPAPTAPTAFSSANPTGGASAQRRPLRAPAPRQHAVATPAAIATPAVPSAFEGTAATTAAAAPAIAGVGELDGARPDVADEKTIVAALVAGVAEKCAPPAPRPPSRFAPPADEWQRHVEHTLLNATGSFAVTEAELEGRRGMPPHEAAAAILRARAAPSAPAAAEASAAIPPAPTWSPVPAKITDRWERTVFTELVNIGEKAATPRELADLRSMPPHEAAAAIAEARRTKRK